VCMCVHVCVGVMGGCVGECVCVCVCVCGNSQDVATQDSMVYNNTPV